MKVSVIVPIYNVENYLRKCLETLIHQTLEEIEIILVNDNSPDGCKEVMEEYALKDNRIQCIYLSENHMMGGARNKGVEIARGEYITFVDSDDYVETTLCEKLYVKAKETDSDMVYCVYRYEKENGEAIKDVPLFPPEYDGKLTENKKRGVINKLAFPWGKLFRRAVWIDHHISFPDKIIYEDGPTIPLAILYMNRCAYVEEALYHYVQHDKSAMNKRNAMQHMDTQKSALILKERMIARGLYQAYQEETDFYVITRYYKNMLEICLNLFDQPPISIMKDTRKYLANNIKNYSKNKYYLTFTGEERLLMKMNDIHPKLAVWWYNHRKAIMKRVGKRREGLLYYKKYYQRNQQRIIELLNHYQGRNIGIWGAGLKKAAFLSYVNRTHATAIKYDIIERDRERISGDEVLLSQVLDEVDTIFVINPSFYMSIKKSLEESNRTAIQLVNLEDYLNGFIKLEDMRDS